MDIQVANPLRENQELGINQKNLYQQYSTGQYVNGEIVSIFEKNLANFFNIKYATTLNSGTDALLLGLIALNIKKGDEVLLPSFTYFATVETVLQLGAIPVFLDIEPVTYCINLDDAAKKITKKTSAIIPVHLFGNNANIKEVSSFAKKNNLKVLEDCAQSFGSMDTNKKLLGTFGDCSAFSFFPSKTLGGIGDGGCLITNNKKIYDEVKSLKNHGQESQYKHHRIGFNSRLDSLNAFVLNEKLKGFNRIRKSRLDLFNFYTRHLESIDSIKKPVMENKNIVLNYFTIRVPKNKRAALMNKLNAKGIKSSIYYENPIHKQPIIKKLSLKTEKLANTEKISREIMSIPFYAFMKKVEKESVVKELKKFTF